MYDWKKDIEYANDNLDFEDSYVIMKECLIHQYEIDCEPYDENDIEDDINSGSFTLRCISKNSYLFDLLEEWFDDRSLNMENVIRGFYEDRNYIYFFHGGGYSIYSADLLGGTATGEAEFEFDDFVSDHLYRS